VLAGKAAAIAAGNMVVLVVSGYTGSRWTLRGAAGGE